MTGGGVFDAVIDLDMNRVIAIDPGAKVNAWALFAAGSERLLESGTGFRYSSGIRQVIWERPQVDERTAAIDVRNILDVAINGAKFVGALAEISCAEVVEYTPTEWKGSEPKPLNHRRLWAVLDDDERVLFGGAKTWKAIDAACEKGALSRWRGRGGDFYPRSQKILTDRLDAAALGCFYLGRLKRA